MYKKSRQKFKYFENEKRFQDEINSIFHHFLRAIIEGNKRNFFWKVKVRRYTFLQIRFQICCYLWGPGTVNLNIPKYFIQLNLYFYLVVYNMNWSRVKYFSFLSRAYVLTCLSIIFVPTCAQFSRAYVPWTTHKIYCSSVLSHILLFFSGLFDLSFNLKPQNSCL